ncbi:hypothetical protein Taro_001382 [Colocasia esculenta]|uniref:Uncharacterized protein n=1 Tax=Colocasia esculenta TaxID=4460 RepID=A0A843THV4_COLES|nr:hypothetical protein [Colocasia esculenta]
MPLTPRSLVCVQRSCRPLLERPETAAKFVWTKQVVWRSSWWLRSCGTTTRSRSSSPSRLLRPAQTTLLRSTKGRFSRAKP